jgi:signal-transduction protein with cAMP-binding, CBS, and nucleotidyltransferase domain
MQVRDGMSEITLTVGPSHTLREAAEKMVEKGTGAALVIDAELPTPSVVTERDLLIAVAQGKNPAIERVADHMSEGVITAAPEWSLERAAAEMSRRNVRPLVFCVAGAPIGVLSLRDIVRCCTSDGATSEMPLPS